MRRDLTHTYDLLLSYSGLVVVRAHGVLSELTELYLFCIEGTILTESIRYRFVKNVPNGFCHNSLRLGVVIRRDLTHTYDLLFSYSGLVVVRAHGVLSELTELYLFCIEGTILTESIRYIWGIKCTEWILS